MLGEQIGQESGKIVGFRVHPIENNQPKIEISFQGAGKILGMDCTDMGTYYSLFNNDGTMHGKGQGMMTTSVGDMAYWEGEAVGRHTGSGYGASWRGNLYFRTISQKLARLNGMAVMFEYEVKDDGSFTVKTWEWK